MAADNLPSEFDVVILGTGLAESVVAAACSRVGQRVLHLDRRNYYAGNWASFTFNGLLSWIEEYKAQQETPNTESEQGWVEKIEEGEDVLPLSSTDSSITNLEVFSYTSEESEEEEEVVKVSMANCFPKDSGATAEESSDIPIEAQDSPDDSAQGAAESQKQGVESTDPSDNEQTPETQQSSQSNEGDKEEQPITNPAEAPVELKKKITYAKLLKEGRRFNIDLVSKLLYSRGSLVDLLIKSNVSRYAEFKNVNRILTCRDGKVEQVPCSRADVFGSKQLSVVEKRMLMKFLTFCLDFEQHPEEFQGFSEKPFWEFLKSQKLTENLQHFVLHSIAMAAQETPTEDGLKATQHFLRCLGRYGNTPFLFPLYGLGEIPQCFCRCKAVIDTHGQRISCNHFVVEDGYLRDEQRAKTSHRQISRAVVITDRSVLSSDSDQQISLVTVPPLESSSPAVRAVELSSSSMTCMPGTYLVHLTCPALGSAREDLAPVVSRLFHVPNSPEEEPVQGSEESEKPLALWVMYFNMRDTSGLDTSCYSLPSNVHVCTGPDANLGSDYSIKLAESVFNQLLPDEEFCPPAPNPEDIIYDGDGAQGEGASFEEENGPEENGPPSESSEECTDSATQRPNTESDVQIPSTEE
ncbi:rab proteins geranylgeranyltransferase component A 1 isoform X2 [Brachyhypopomus gauderio]|uniref:rab proteins geranylgeranyltransferase component A 1 isoform X2 n=1 Tax=Brachyhypopomus gauderio TaxID=698409 RepID=UPI004041D498